VSGRVCEFFREEGTIIQAYVIELRYNCAWSRRKERSVMQTVNTMAPQHREISFLGAARLSEVVE
jgi:hypothetical protein